MLLMLTMLGPHLYRRGDGHSTERDVELKTSSALQRPNGLETSEICGAARRRKDVAEEGRPTLFAPYVFASLINLSRSSMKRITTMRRGRSCVGVGAG